MGTWVGTVCRVGSCRRLEADTLGAAKGAGLGAALGRGEDGAAGSLVSGAALGIVTVSLALTEVQNKLLLMRLRPPMRLALLKRKDWRWLGFEDC